ncbi:BgTH12-05578 [Blumeria graminis f. sp. triticale]|uniref:Bgt-50188 n=2 Tax=Blumeria graminis TaxID=34373 RepID=A0A9X9MK52_BLUGR|nr:BgTH12-05578 [Blumeria graminis f. sp. triticale]VDB90496.1 Bgt-50188 [Blumeria graminis f. sp. tritici]
MFLHRDIRNNTYLTFIPFVLH